MNCPGELPEKFGRVSCGICPESGGVTPSTDGLLATCTWTAIRSKVSQMRLTPAEIRAVVALAVGMFCVQVDFFALNLALPRMAVDLNQTTTNMQWVISAYMIAVGAATVFVLIPATMLFGGASLLATSAVDAWGAYVPPLGLTGFALGLGWTLPSIGSQTVVDPSRAGEAAGVNLTVMVTIAGVAVALAGTLIELGGAGTTDIAAATQGVVRLVSLLSLVGGAVLLAIALIGRSTRQASEIASPAS